MLTYWFYNVSYKIISANKENMSEQEDVINKAKETDEEQTSEFVEHEKSLPCTSEKEEHCAHKMKEDQEGKQKEGEEKKENDRKESQVENKEETFKLQGAIDDQVQKVVGAIPYQVKEKFNEHLFQLAFFIAMQITYFCINFLDFTVVTMLGRFVQFQLFVFILYQIMSRLIYNITHFETSLQLKIRSDIFEPVLVFVERNSEYLKDLILARRPLKTLGFIMVLQVVCIVGKMISGLTFLYLVLNWLIIAPIVYKYQKDQINSMLDLANKKFDQLLKLMTSRVPPQIMDAFQKFLTKVA